MTNINFTMGYSSKLERIEELRKLMIDLKLLVENRSEKVVYLGRIWTYEDLVIVAYEYFKLSLYKPKYLYNLYHVNKWLSEEKNILVKHNLVWPVTELSDEIVKNHKFVAERIRVQRPWLAHTENISLAHAQEFIKHTTWWHSHSSGHPVRAPNHSKYVYMSGHGWTISFGANFFLVGKAIERSNNDINKYIDETAKGSIPDIEKLKQKLKL